MEASQGLRLGRVISWPRVGPWPWPWRLPRPAAAAAAAAAAAERRPAPL